MIHLPTKIEQGSLAWRDAATLPEATLLRLAILRDILGAIHAEKSVLLSRGSRQDAQGFQLQEKRLERLRQSATLPATLEEALNQDTEFKKRTRLIPDALYQVIDREKLERYDRAWEFTLAGEASYLGWKFWALKVWVEISGAEAFHRALSDRLNPNGLVLYAETVPGSDTSGEHWHGQWIVLLKPRYFTPDFRIAELPAATRGKTSPEWKLLFSPRPR